MAAESVRRDARLIAGVTEFADDGQHFVTSDVPTVVQNFVVVDRGGEFSARLGKGCMRAAELSAFCFSVVSYAFVSAAISKSGRLAGRLKRRNGKIAGCGCWCVS